MNYIRPLFFLLLLLQACQEKEKKLNTSGFIEIPVSCKEGGEPNLFVSETGKIFLSWVEYLNDSTDALLFSTLSTNEWSLPHTIAYGSDWFVNWADFPSLVAYEDKEQSLAAHWLQKSASGTYDYDIHITQSTDAGITWSPSFVLHRDGIPAEHGFVSLLPLNKDSIFATWLDGRNTKNKITEQYTAMTLRAAIFNKEGQVFDEAELDPRVCDCCQTSAAKTEEGIIIAYRDRSAKEIRDISIVRQVGGIWTKPKTIYEDSWFIAGCPVNGPVIKANGKVVAVAWYSKANEEAKVRLAFSLDSGKTFLPPIRVDHGAPLGRIDLVMLSKNEALISWIEEKEDHASLFATRVNSKGVKSDPILITRTASSRRSGFPVMAYHDNQVIFAWTEVDSLTRVKSGILELD